MEALTEISTKEKGENAFDVIMRCKELASQIDIANVISGNTCIDEKEMLIVLIQSIRKLELEIIQVGVPIMPEAEA